MIMYFISSVCYFCSAVSGGGGAGRRKILVLHLIRSCREMEMKFVVRTLVRHPSFLLENFKNVFEAALHGGTADYTSIL